MEVHARFRDADTGHGYVAVALTDEERDVVAVEIRLSAPRARALARELLEAADTVDEPLTGS